MLQKKHNDALGLFLVFIGGVLLHLLICVTVMNFPKSFHVIPDEFRYYCAARSFFYGDGMNLAGIPSHFQKIGYALILMPFFAISDVVLRLKAIAVGNIIIMELSVIFAWLLAGELGLSRRAKYFIAVFTAILPEMMISFTFMSEVLYWPLFLLFFWVWAVNERKESYLLAVFEGIICYITYLTKEVFLAAVLGYIAFEILYPLIESRPFERKRLVRLGVFIASFAVCYLAVKLTFFRGMGNSYNQMSLQAIMSPYNFLFLMYAFFYYIAGILAAGLIITFVYPFVNFRSMNEQARKMYVHIIMFMIVTSATLAYTISVREELGNVKVSVLLRYYGGAFLILIMTMFACLQSIDEQVVRFRRNAVLTALAFALMYVCLIFKGFTTNNSISHLWLFWYLAIDMLFGILNPPAVQVIRSYRDVAAAILPSTPQTHMYLSAVIASLFLTVIVMIFHYIYTRRTAKQAKTAYAALLVTMSLLINWAECLAIKFSYAAPPEAVNELVAINEYFKNDKDSELMYLTHGHWKSHIDAKGKHVFTYIDRTSKFYMVNDAVFKGDSSTISETVLKSAVVRGKEPPGVYEGVRKIDYILIHNYDSRGMRKLSNVEKIDSLSGKYYTLYRNLTPSELHFEQ